MKYLPFGFLFLFLAFAVGCGEEPSHSLSSSDVAYIRAKRYQEQYGSSTSTVSSTVTVTATSTATVSSTTTVY